MMNKVFKCPKCGKKYYNSVYRITEELFSQHFRITDGISRGSRDNDFVSESFLYTIFPCSHRTKKEPEKCLVKD